MTDDLAEAKRHIRALMKFVDHVIDEDMTCGYGSPFRPQEWIEAQAFLDAEGQTVEPELTCDFQNAFPDGTRDMSNYDEIETALDLADAPVMDGGRWLKLPERITAFAAELTRLKAAQPEHDRTVRLAALEEAAMWHERKAEETATLARAGWHMIAARGIRSLIDQTGGEGGI